MTTPAQPSASQPPIIVGNDNSKPWSLPVTLYNFEDKGTRAIVRVEIRAETHEAAKLVEQAIMDFWNDRFTKKLSPPFPVGAEQSGKLTTYTDERCPTCGQDLPGA